MIHSRRMLATVALACLVLGGCWKQAAEGTRATGEVLEGTISDAMIATDQTRSDPPLAPHSAKVAGDKGAKAKEKPGDEAVAEAAAVADTGAAADPAPNPQPSPSEPAG